MTPLRDRLRQMEHEVARFHLSSDDRNHNHERFLSEALQSLRGASDPLEALRLLEALQRSSYARRPEPRQALADVGAWLGQRLRAEPNVDRDTLALELGWLRRVVVIRLAKATDARPATPYTRGGPLPALPDLAATIASIERARGPAKPVRPTKPEVAAPPPRVAPERLPAAFEAEFADVGAARDSRKKAREREKAGKPKKVTWLALKPADALLSGLAKGLACALDTAGCEAVFEDMARRDGRPRAFWVADVRGDEGRLVVGRITLDRPPPDRSTEETP